MSEIHNVRLDVKGYEVVMGGDGKPALVKAQVVAYLGREPLRSEMIIELSSPRAAQVTAFADALKDHIVDYIKGRHDAEKV